MVDENKLVKVIKSYDDLKNSKSGELILTSHVEKFLRGTVGAVNYLKILKEKGGLEL